MSASTRIEEPRTAAAPRRSHPPAGRLLRHSRWDAWLVAGAIGHAVVLLGWPSVPVIGLGLWWHSNAITHNHIHNPLFRSPRLNRLFGHGSTLLLGYPFRLWRDRHLAHHAEVSGGRYRWRWSGELMVQVLLLIALWATLALSAPTFALTVYLPGWLLGMGLCALQGHFEHVGGATVAHYGRLYNWLFFNDGYHVEHHRRASVHWRELPGRREPDRGLQSRYPPVLRFLEGSPLDWLESIGRRSGPMRAWLVRVHRRAIGPLIDEACLPPGGRVGIVGGGLFPRTAWVLRALRPDATLILVDRSAAHLEMAVAELDAAAESGDAAAVEAFATRSVETRIGTFPEVLAELEAVDLWIVPLAYRGCRDSLYRHPPGRAVLVHDWVWRRRGRGRVVSWWLLKRVNRIDRCLSECNDAGVDPCDNARSRPRAEAP